MYLKFHNNCLTQYSLDRNYLILKKVNTKIMFMQLYQKIDRKLVHQNQNPSKHNIHIVVTI